MTSIATQYSRVNDLDLLLEFRDSLTDQAEVLERQIAILRKNPDDPTAVSALFRALHTVKGDASICLFELGVRIVHPIENLLVHMREGKLRFTPLLAEAMLLAVDRLELAVETLISGRPLESLKLDALVHGLDRLDPKLGPQLDKMAIEMIEAVTGFRPVTAQTSAPSSGKPEQRIVDRTSDLAFFESLALQFDSLSPHFKGRTGRLLQLAQETNTRGGKPVDPAQLEAAVYMHDVGMMFLPGSVWLKVGTMSDDDRRLLHTHPSYGAGLLERMSGWNEAAKIIAQHHEMVNGRGYPNGLKENQIVAGAKILSIVDAFESVTQKHLHRGEGRSLLRAIAEINANDSQFSPEWIGHFNTVIRGMLEG